MKIHFFLAFMVGLTLALSSSALLKRAGRPVGFPEGGIARAAAVLPNEASLTSQSGGVYSLNWNTLDGGGGQAAGSASGGTYQLNFTLGQPDAGSSSGGAFQLQGGFWPGGVQPYQDYLPLLIH